MWTHCFAIWTDRASITLITFYTLGKTNKQTNKQTIILNFQPGFFESVLATTGHLVYWPAKGGF
jgi:hypothetical protein